ncbi:MAG TPA: LysM peptidoglycan-binding domain-containing protein [Gaiellaceae bacterium]|jgi:nucleoid-associated protein YgaU|nr:LysM peptidoglycan-binding domain-containing protein [Gaiellaceae bacterium]
MFARVAVVVALLAFVWTAIAHPLGAHGPKQSYVVRPYDTLWTIASTRYAGDTRAAVYRIEQANHLDGRVLRPGQVIVLP